jgi:glycosyltransferase involved in cell wall biosynthesis
MRVAHVMAYFAPAYRYGGPPRTVYALCRALHDAGIEIEVFTTTANGSHELTRLEQRALAAPFPVHYFQRIRPRSLYASPALVATLRRVARTFDVVHVHGLWNATVMAAARIAQTHDVPYVMSPRGMLQPGALAHHARRKSLMYRLGHRRDLERAALIHASSLAEAKTIASRRLGPPLFMVPNGVAVHESTPAAAIAMREALEIPAQAPIILFLGRLHPIKRLDLLAAAFARVRAARPDAHLVLAGHDETWHRTAVEQWLGEHRSHARFTGHVEGDAAAALLHAANVLAQCSDSESFGMSVAEGLAAGTPVVVTRTCPWEIVERERCGCWVPQDVNAIAAAILMVVNDPDGAARAGARGRALVQRELAWPAIASQIAEGYHAVAHAAAARDTSLQLSGRSELPPTARSARTE